MVERNPRQSNRRYRPLEALLFGAALLLALAAAWRLVSVEASVFLTDVVVDDAAYFLVPARHLLEGAGYSFDGGQPTNGVQPLWALVTLILAAAITDDVAAMRAMSLLSGLLWIGGGIVLFCSLRRSQRLPGLLIACGWILAGFVDRMAFQGMENGLHGLLCVLLVAFAARLHRRGMQQQDRGGLDRRGLVIFGLLTALLTSSRIESGLLAALLFPCILLGWLGPPDRREPGNAPVQQEPEWPEPSLRSSSQRSASLRTPRLRWGDAIAFALPNVLLVGGTLIASKCLFDSFTPISGRVKMFYEACWSAAPPVHGSWVENLYWHFRFIRHLALAPLSDFVSHSLSQWSAWAIDGAAIRRVLLVVYGIGLAGWSVRRWRWCARRRRSDEQQQSQQQRWQGQWQGPLPDQEGRGRVAAVLVPVLAGFALLHLVMMAVLLPHFTGYATWYFAAEVLALWVFAGWALWSALGLCAVFLPPRAGRRLLRIARLGLPLFVVAAAVPRLLSPLADDPRTGLFLRAGRWLEAGLPPGQRIGCCSAGIVAIAAPGHRVYNLDGLIGSTRYFEDFLVENRVHEFFAEERIRYFADYQDLATWRDGISWHGNIPLHRLRLLRWWRLDEGAGYAVCEILPEGARHELLGPHAVDRLAEFRFAAEVLGRFEVVGEKELAGCIAAGKRVAASIPLHPSGRLRHVVLDAASLAALDLEAVAVRPEQELSIRFTDGFALYGLDLPEPVVRPGQRLVVTCYWQRTVGSAPGEGQHGHRVHLSLEPVLPSGNPGRRQDPGVATTARVRTEGVPCQGTRPPESWRPGQAVVDCHVLELPRDLRRGGYRLLLQVRRSDGTPVDGYREGVAAPAERFVLESIRVR